MSDDKTNLIRLDYDPDAVRLLAEHPSPVIANEAREALRQHEAEANPLRGPWVKVRDEDDTYVVLDYDGRMVPANAAQADAIARAPELQSKLDEALAEVVRLRKDLADAVDATIEAEGLKEEWESHALKRLATLTQRTAERDACRAAMEACMHAIVQDGGYGDAGRAVDRARDLLRCGEGGDDGER